MQILVLRATARVQAIVLHVHDTLLASGSRYSRSLFILNKPFWTRMLWNAMRLDGDVLKQHESTLEMFCCPTASTCRGLPNIIIQPNVLQPSTKYKCAPPSLRCSIVPLVRPRTVFTYVYMVHVFRIL